MTKIQSEQFFIVSYDKKKYFHIIEDFNCGVETLNKFLKELPSHYCSGLLFMQRDQKGHEKILAYCAYRCYSIKIEDDVYPAIEIRGFARDQCVKGKNIGKLFLANVFKFFEYISKNVISAKYICLHAINTPEIISFYEYFGFQRISSDTVILEDGFNEECVPMFVAISK